MATTPPMAVMPPLAAAADARSWLDVQGLESLKAASSANPHDPKTVRAVAQQFESLFIGMMLKSMREAKLGDGMFDSDQSRFYQDLFDQQLSVVLAQGRGLGIADLLVRSLNPEAAAQALPATYEKSLRRQIGAARLPAAVGAAALASGTVPASAPAAGPLAATPEEFVQLVWPSASAAGAELGVDPRALIAQAALESDWGRQVPAAEGGSSHNLFGIKADASWSGRSVLKDTVEYAGGIATRRREPFRAYDSVAHSFEDYVEFIKSRPRYVAAVQQGADPQRFGTALQEAGYATDPAYAHKLSAILGSTTLQAAISAFKDGTEPPIF